MVMGWMKVLMGGRCDAEKEKVCNVVGIADLKERGEANQAVNR